jgi:hypothetical protein
MRIRGGCEVPVVYSRATVSLYVNLMLIRFMELRSGDRPSNIRSRAVKPQCNVPVGHFQ